MKSTRHGWKVSIVGLLLMCGAAFAQDPSAAGGMRGMRLGGGLPFSQQGVPLRNAPKPEAQSAETPALSLTWSIYTFPGTVATYTGSVNKSGHMVGGYGPDFVQDLPNHKGAHELRSSV